MEVVFSMRTIDNLTNEELKNILQSSKSLKEVIRKIGYSPRSGENAYCKIIESLLQRGFTESEIPTKRNFTHRTYNNTFCEGSTASQASVRRSYKILGITPYICSICGQEPFWNGKALTLILDHKNGISNDSRVENLRWVCPNCNQQLETTGYKSSFRNKLNNKEPWLYNEAQEISKKITYCEKCGCKISKNAHLCINCHNDTQRKCITPSKLELYNILKKYGNFKKVGLLYGVSDNTVRNWCTKYGLSTSFKDYR